MKRHILLLAAAALAASGSAAMAQMRITEWAYQGTVGGEFIEFTNVGGAAINMAGWSYSDELTPAGTVGLGAFGVVNPGESVILTEITAAAFRTAWGLPMTVDVIGGNATNLGRNDQINLWNNLNALVDTLRYGDDSYKPGSIRTNNASGNPIAFSDLGTNNVYNWKLSVNGDVYGSHATTPSGNLGNPGLFTLTVPEPTSVGLALVGGVMLLGACARRRLRAAAR